MAKTPLPDGDAPPDPRTELLADLDARLAAPRRGEAVAPPSSPGDGRSDRFVRPEQVDLVLRLHQLGAEWRDRSGYAAGAAVRRIDRFEIVRRVGEGGFASVYEAIDPLLSRRVALKVAHPAVLVSPAMRRRFLREAELAARVTHPNLVTIHDVGERDGVIFIAEEFCAGGSLAAWLAARPGPVEPRVAADVVRALAEGLDAAHRRRIVHRDIKPGNVLLSPADGPGTLPAADADAREHGWQVKLGDFGLGMLDDSLDADPLSRLTRAGTAIGTPAWMAPEQIDRTVGAIGPATDIHALGLLLDRLLVGRCRWIGGSDADTMRMILLRESEAIDKGVPWVPPDLLAVCRKCLARSPGERYASAGDLAADLSRFLLGMPTHARPLSAWERTCRWAARRPAVVGSGLAVVLAATIAAVSLWGWSRQSSAVTRQQDRLRGIDAVLHLQRGVDDLRSGGAAAGRARITSGLSLDPELVDSFAGRWARRLERCEREVLFGDPRAAAATADPPRDLHCLAVSPDGATIAAGAADGRLILLAADGSRPPLVIEGAHDEINDVVFSPDGLSLATAGQDGRLRLFEAPTGRPTATLAEERAPLFAAAFSPDGRLFSWGGEAQELAVADRDGGPERRFRVPFTPREGAEGADIEAALFVDGATIAVAGGPEVLLVAAEDGRVLHRFSGHGGSVGTLDLSPDGTRLLSAGTDRRPRIWDIVTGELLTVLPLHGHWVQGCVFTADGRRVASGCRDGVLHVFDIATGGFVARLPGHTGRHWDVRREPGGTVVTAGADGTVRRFVPDGSSVLAGAGAAAVIAGPIQRVLPLPIGESATGGSPAEPAGGPHVVVVPVGGPCLVVDATGRPVGEPWPGSDGAHHDAALDATHGRLALVPAGDGEVRVVTPAGAIAPVHALDTHAYRCRWTPEGQLLSTLSGGRGGIVGRDATLASEVRIADDGILYDDLAVSPDGRALAAAGGSALRVTPIARGGVPRPTGPPRIFQLDTASGEVARIAWSPDGRRLAVGSKEGDVRIVSAADGSTLGILPGHRTRILTLAWCPDGRTLLSADEEMLRICDTATGMAIDGVAPGWMIRDVALAGPPSRPDRWLVVGGEARADAPSSEHAPGRGRLLVIDLDR